jgi:hypothetical protein
MDFAAELVMMCLVTDLSEEATQAPNFISRRRCYCMMRKKKEISRICMVEAKATNFKLTKGKEIMRMRGFRVEKRTRCCFV